MKIFGLDISIRSTSLCTLCTDTKKYEFDCIAEHSKVYGKTKMLKWFNFASNIATIHTYNKEIKQETNSSRNIEKHQKYNEIANKIFNIILEKSSDENLFCIEDYSIGSDVGHLVDLVTLGTLVRDKIINSNLNCKVILITPSELKQWAAKLAYERSYKNKKKTSWMYRNKMGVAGGSFKKPEIHQSILDSFIVSEYQTFLKTSPPMPSSIPNPIEDMNDSYVLANVGRAVFEKLDL